MGYPRAAISRQKSTLSDGCLPLFLVRFGATGFDAHADHGTGFEFGRDGELGLGREPFHDGVKLVSDGWILGRTVGADDFESEVVLGVVVGLGFGADSPRSFPLAIVEDWGRGFGDLVFSYGRRNRVVKASVALGCDEFIDAGDVVIVRPAHAVKFGLLLQLPVRQDFLGLGVDEGEGEYATGFFGWGSIALAFSLNLT